jgi:hypothetical protein
MLQPYSVGKWIRILLGRSDSLPRRYLGFGRPHEQGSRQPHGDKGWNSFSTSDLETPLPSSEKQATTDAEVHGRFRQALI